MDPLKRNTDPRKTKDRAVQNLTTDILFRKNNGNPKKMSKDKVGLGDIFRKAIPVEKIVMKE